MCLFLDISAEEAAERGGYGEERYESSQMQDRVRELFGILQRSPEKDDFVRIDAGQFPGEVEQDILRAVENSFKNVDSKQLPLRKVAPWLRSEMIDLPAYSCTSQLSSLGRDL